MNITDFILSRTQAPVIAAPMFLVSNPALALACCRAGIVGSFAAHSARTSEELQAWLEQMRAGLEGDPHAAPYAVNLVVHPSNPRMAADLQAVVRYRVPIVLTSKGAPGEVFLRIHDYGGYALHDVASRRHAEKAGEAGADGVIAVCAGAGGHTGTLNPFALLGEIRQAWDGPVVLAGGIVSGSDVLAAQAMGAQFAYIGTPFIAAQESSASAGYRDMVLASDAAEVFFTAVLDGAPANFLRPSLEQAGIDVEALRYAKPGQIIAAQEGAKRWKNIWSAGQSVGRVREAMPAAAYVGQLITQYAEARRRMSDPSWPAHGST